MAIFEIVIWQVPRTSNYPDGIKYRAWVSEDGKTLFGFDNHKPKGPHLHIGDHEVGYVFRGIAALRFDIEAMIKKGRIYFMKTTKVLLIVEPTKSAINRAFSALKKSPTAKKYTGFEVISFPDFETLGRVITGARLELLSMIREHQPKSIQELARIVKRDFKNVHTDVKLLAQFGLIDLKEAGPRKSASPVAKFTEIVLAA
jgi:predicted transcriptional regulator